MTVRVETNNFNKARMKEVKAYITLLINAEQIVLQVAIILFY
jgi:hypothetical protein